MVETYKLEAEFKDRHQAKKGFEVIRKYLQSHLKAWEEWQKARGSDNETPQEKHDRLVQKYPLAFLLFPAPVRKVDEGMNQFAGYLTNGLRDPLRFELKDKTVYLESMEWHLSNWDHLIFFVHAIGGKGRWGHSEIGWMLNALEVNPNYNPLKSFPPPDELLDILSSDKADKFVRERSLLKNV